MKGISRAISKKIKYMWELGDEHRRICSEIIALEWWREKQNTQGRLSPEEKKLIGKQLKAMCKYRDILLGRKELAAKEFAALHSSNGAKKK